MSAPDDAAVGHGLGTPMVCSCVYPTDRDIEEMRSALRGRILVGPSLDLALLFMAEACIERDGCPMHSGKEWS